MAQEHVVFFGNARAETAGIQPRIHVEHRAFTPEEVVDISADTLFTASEKLGTIQKDIVQTELADLLSSLSSKERDAAYADVGFQLARIDELKKRGVCVVDGIDYLSRYMDAVDGFAKGAGITRNDAALLQSEIMAGCQTMIVQDKKSGNIGFIHTEENGSDEKLAHGEYRYKLVRMKTHDTAVQFLAYPGLASWGAAFGVNEKTGMVQLVDDLVLRSDMGLGDIWANALAFMTLDAGSINKTNALVSNLAKANPPVVFTGGYAIHCIEPGKPPRFQSIEFAGESIHTVPPEQNKGVSYVVQVNVPRDAMHEKYAEYRVPRSDEPWDEDRAQVGIEMARRMNRLRTWSKKERGLVSNDPKKVIDSGLRILAMPQGDIEDIGGERTVTGLANEYVAAHAVGYIGERGTELVFGKTTPPQIPGKEYSFQTKGNTWARTELRHIAKIKKVEHKAKQKIRSLFR